MVESVKLAVAAKSWKTTACGILGGLALLIPSALALLDDDPLTKLNLTQCLEGLALMGLGVAARDNNKSSEAVGAVK